MKQLKPEVLQKAVNLIGQLRSGLLDDDQQSVLFGKAHNQRNLTGQ